MNIRLAAFLVLALGCWGISTAPAAVVVSEFFTGRIQSFDPTTSAETNFATIGGNPGLSGLAFSQASNTLYASALNHGGVYRFNAQTGSLIGFSSLGIGASGIAVSAIGNVYVSDFTSNNVRIYDSTLTNQLGIITVPGGATSGVGFVNNGDVIIATPGNGVFRFDGVNVTSFSANPLASAQIATDALGNTFVGHGIGFSDSVFRYDPSGNLLGTIDITAAMVNSTGSGSSSGTSPGGVAFDPDGNLFIAVLGQSNPGDAGGERGGLFKFDVDGNLLETFAAGSNAYSSVVFVTAIPEPGSFVVLALSAISVVAYRRSRQLKSANPESLQ